jgi:hypothetical protein
MLDQPSAGREAFNAPPAAIDGVFVFLEKCLGGAGVALDCA